MIARPAWLPVPLARDAKRSVSRINRVVRFSPDKRVYKDHAVATFTRVPCEMPQGLLHVPMGAGEAFAGIGLHAMDPAQLSALRRRIAEQPEECFRSRPGLPPPGTSSAQRTRWWGCREASKRR